MALILALHMVALEAVTLMMMALVEMILMSIFTLASQPLRYDTDDGTRSCTVALTGMAISVATKASVDNIRVRLQRKYTDV